MHGPATCCSEPSIHRACASLSALLACALVDPLKSCSQTDLRRLKVQRMCTAPEHAFKCRRGRPSLSVSHTGLSVTSRILQIVCLNLDCWIILMMRVSALTGEANTRVMGGSTEAGVRLMTNTVTRGEGSALDLIMISRICGSS